ncbi:MAG: hypothetical protein NT028_02760, partial [candidate division Zixibacteria bacterium]|nr:hypothetical protein [candidate division Zixibacteria bacterium]
MKRRDKNGPNKKAGVLFLIGALTLFFLIGGQALALTDHIVFCVNGDTTATSMVQGEYLAWGANCDTGATLFWEIWYDVNNDSIIDDPGDKLVTTFTIADGDTNSHDSPPDTNPVPDGFYMKSLTTMGIAPGQYIFRVTDMSDDSKVSRAFRSIEYILPPNKFVGRITVEDHPAPDSSVLKWVWIEASADDDQMWSGFTDDSGNFSINVGISGTDVSFEISAKEIPGYVEPSKQSAIASGIDTLDDFAYVTPSDSVYGTVTDEHGANLP